ncbi:hypothetical protein A2962_03780 [Candidatus Woesebacteria bacterium RIFCSPLOWO2_01_FULL_39_61]|uniref:Sortase n=1 Tax=Candidatus Woesebacteria bacterium RIFCSPHIGHO2_02_FULL_39_13 TaxID=1802505 RepID=A0A1F7Z2Q8_9BACT|nr:MAG: hypothetical protein A2692_03960 [Candidatus Woesebacteria bacterium RIFCSPHIGHO2_01_FULL_39_95]OGM33811.1 MAG: hypothetical protein A3D01_02470 [Candidatus Woesebacteria bacterium RIFCSPHIGHO2_02_FULL_39_13]OGM38972.1 MAG: hypothetical protein A3E13_04740 [Candidatus Woesebacteria bacterium RIFCSPHIGHO2_12_FULL_40_20]OGM65620.1 MAG: hypothetical protein A2962_03780 [Candidatus Woesebacteria bacterium RIFCSPLOWO2_01_FULL_39_61]OGM72808.1 MAG: hypothetical protein A3H19_05605 [Candidatus
MKKEPSKLTLGLALFILGLLLSVGQLAEKSQYKTVTFANEPVEIKGLSETDGVDDLPKRVIIPELSINLEVKKAEIVNGFWEVFSEGSAWGSGSGLPGKPGNQVIFAHAREGLFLPLKDVAVGMAIYVLTDDKWYGYKVKEIKEVYPDQIEVISPTEDETLTLYTCSGFQDSKRLIVVAKRS